MKQFSFETQLLHVDTTNFGVYGKYENDAPDSTDSIKLPSAMPKTVEWI
jgi:hypothetical protein